MKRSIFQLASVAFVGIIIGKGLRFAFNVVIARGLGAEALGVFAFGLVVAKTISVLARMGLDQAAQKYIPVFSNADQSSKLSGLVFLCTATPLLVGSIFAFVLYTYTPIIEAFVGFDINAGTRLFFIGIPILAFFQVSVIATRGFKETKYTVISRDLVQSVLGIVLIGVGVYVFGSVEAAIIGYLFSLIIGGLTASLFIYRYDSVTIIPLELPIKKIMMFSMPLIVVGVSSQLVNWSDVFLLGILSSERSVGEYHAAYQSSVILTFVLAGINAIFPSVASDLYSQGQHERLEQLYSVCTKWIFSLTTIGCALVIAFAPTLLSVFETVTPDAVLSLQVLAVAQTITVSTGPVGYLLIMGEYEKVETLNTIGVAILNVILNLVLIQRYGIVGAAVATGLSLSIYNIIRVLEAYHFIGVLPFGSKYTNSIIPLFGSLAPVIVISQLVKPNLWVVFGCGLCSLCVFFALVWVTGFEETDRKLFEAI